MMYHLHGLKITCVIWLAGVSAAGADVEIRLRDQAVTSGGLVRLGDVADVGADDEARGRQLASIALMPAPAPGSRWFVTRRAIEDLLTALAVDTANLRFDGATQVAISSTSPQNTERVAEAPMNRHAAVLAGQSHGSPDAKLSAARAEELRDQIHGLIVRHLNEKAGRDGEWQIDCDVADRHLTLLDAATSPLVCQGGAAPWSGRQRFTVSFHSRDGAVQFPVYADVSAAATPVVVALRPIARGATITTADIELRSVDYVPTTSGRRQSAKSVESLIGMEARQAIRVEEVIFSDQVQAPVVVKRGDVITVSSQSGGIRVRTTARARQDGARGELVQVESLETRERYDVRVIGPREAAVFALARSTKPEPAERIDTARR